MTFRHVEGDHTDTSPLFMNRDANIIDLREWTLSMEDKNYVYDGVFETPYLKMEALWHGRIYVQKTYRRSECKMFRLQSFTRLPQDPYRPSGEWLKLGDIYYAYRSELMELFNDRVRSATAKIKADQARGKHDNWVVINWKAKLGSVPFQKVRPNTHPKGLNKIFTQSEDAGSW